jgi:hypothetical protein
MNDRFDAWLETGLRDLEAAVPLGQSAAVRPGPAGLVRVSAPGTQSLRPVGSLALAITVIFVVAVVLPRIDAAAPGPSRSTVPSRGGTASSASPLPSPSGTDEITFQLGPFSVVMPSKWHMVTHTVGAPPAGPFIFLSNVAIADPCPVKSLGAQCLRPLAQLPPDGVVVTFDGSATSSLPNPTPVPAVEPMGGACAAMAGERELAVRFQGFGVTACLRGPDFTANETAFDRLVASISGPPPPPGTRLAAALKIPDSGITLSPPGDAVPAISSDAAYQLCLTPGGASCNPSLPTSIELARITDTGSTLVKPGTLVWAMGWIGVTTCTFSGGGAGKPANSGNPGDRSPAATSGQPLCDAYNFIDAHSGKFIFGTAGAHH